MSKEQAFARAQTLAYLTVATMLLSKPAYPWRMDAPSKK